MILIFVMYITIALGFVIAKLTLQYGAPFFTVAFRTITAGSCFLLFQFLFDRANFRIQRKDISLFLSTTFFYVYLVFIPEFWALEKLSASKVILIYTLTPFIVALFAYFLVREKFSLKKIIGMLVGLAGMVVIFITKDAAGKGTEVLYISAREAALLISVISYGYAWFLIKKLSLRGYSLAMINGTTMLLGGTAAAITSFFYEGHFPVTNIPQFLLWATIFTILANGVFYPLYGWLLHHYSFTLLSFAGFLTPIFGIFFGWSILSESITWHHFASLTFIFIGLYLFYQEEIRVLRIRK